ncbi:MAG: DUF1566 domain-containing protein, partial [Deltaproteobacteria bacterium]|nr:DUF1566 domain-containing protein [Deltaproteobacteria bacterium]
MERQSGNCRDQDNEKDSHIRCCSNPIGRLCNGGLKQRFQPFPGQNGCHGRHFVAYDNGTVEDTHTGLMWAAKDNGGPITWREAKSYCSNYRGGGYTDWRMPTQRELTGLYDPKVTNTRPPTGVCNGGCHITNLIHLTCCPVWEWNG